MVQPLRVVSFGECMLELQGAAFGTLQQGYGGDSFNTAVYLQRCGRAQGLQVDYATALGDDPLSDGLLARWQAEGLGTGLVRRLPGKLPGLYLIEVDAQGERRFSYWRGQSAARDHFDTAPGEPTPLEAAAGQIDALYLSGISLAILPPAGRERLLSLAGQLHRRGAWVVFDNNYRPRLWASVAEARHWFGQVLAVSRVALLTLDDELALWGEADANANAGAGVGAARQLARSLDTPCDEVVIKRGSAATLVRLAGGPVAEVPTLAVPQVVDTTAAGDSFAGAYLAARLGGASAVAAAAAGNRLAARVVQHRGAVIDASLMADLMPSPMPTLSTPGHAEAEAANPEP